MHAFMGADKLALHKLNGIIADLLVYFTNVGPQRPGAGMQAIASSPLCGHSGHEDTGLRQELSLLPR
jgi:hypothetical protein